MKLLKFFDRRRKRQRKKGAAMEFEAALSALGPDDICIDCGANVGTITSRFAETGCKVHAFEPEPNCFAILQKKFRAMPNVTLMNAAVGIENSEVELFFADGVDEDFEKLSRASSLYSSKRNIDPTNKIAVRQIDIIAYIRSIGNPISILKMDIEGAEIPILDKIMSEDISLPIRAIFAELHDNKIPEFAAMGTLLRQRAEAQRDIRINLDWN